MINALWITLIGMGLVFLAILLLWGGMVLLVRVTAERERGKATGESGSEADANPGDAGALTAEMDSETAARKNRAAAAAAAVALALRKPIRSENGSGRGGTISAWQAVNRASQVNQAANISRKKVAR